MRYDEGVDIGELRAALFEKGIETHEIDGTLFIALDDAVRAMRVRDMLEEPENLTPPTPTHKPSPQNDAELGR